jgi:hypothetical protein
MSTRGREEDDPMWWCRREDGCDDGYVWEVSENELMAPFMKGEEPEETYEPPACGEFVISTSPSFNSSPYKFI